MGVPLSTLLLCLSTFLSLLPGSLQRAQHYHPGTPCCYGNETYNHEALVESLPHSCLQMRCDDGSITKWYFNQPGDRGCCVFDGQMYAEGTEMPGFCWRLVCRENQWVFTGCVDDCCGHCYVHTDPHFVTFDGQTYDFHGTCNYSLAQTNQASEDPEVITQTPEVGVFTDFHPCFGAASCLDQSTFKDNPNTVITLNTDSVFTLGVNGNSFVVPATGVHQVAFPECGVYHPVLAFQHHGCTVLMGASRITVMSCPYRLDVWAYPSLLDGLNGLCGFYSDYQADDFTDRFSHVHPPHPRPSTFPSTWITDSQTDPQCMEPCEEGRGKGCNANLQALPKDACHPLDPSYQETMEMCQQHLQGIADEYLMATCAHDLCVLQLNGNQLETQLGWLHTLALNAHTSARLLNAIAQCLNHTLYPSAAPPPPPKAPLICPTSAIQYTLTKTVYSTVTALYSASTYYPTTDTTDTTTTTTTRL